MKIRNATRGLFVIQLTHAVCEDAGECSCTSMGGRLVPASAMLLPGEVKELPALAIELPEVDRALRNGGLVLVQEVEQKAKAREREENES